MAEFAIRSINADELAMVYPLIRAATRVSLDRWSEFGKGLLRSGGGIIAVTAADDCAHGVAAYRPVFNLRHEQCLDVEVSVASDLQAGDCVRKRLCQELERIAAQRGCATITFTVDSRSASHSSPTRSGLERLGLRLDTASFVGDLPTSGLK